VERLPGARSHEPPHRFLDSAFGSARNDTFFAVPSCHPDRVPPSCHPDRESVATFQAVVLTEGRSDVSICHPDRESVATSGGIYGVATGSAFPRATP
jgi:hypothetical protein